MVRQCALTARRVSSNLTGAAIYGENMNICDILSINQVDQESAIQKSIEETRKELSGLTEDLTCRIYSRVLTSFLRKNHILPVRIDTQDLDCPYSHIFHLVPLNNEEFYLIDLTYSQFNSHDFEELSKKGYIKVKNESFNDYLEIVGKNRPNISLNQAITKERTKEKNRNK